MAAFFAIEVCILGPPLLTQACSNCSAGRGNTSHPLWQVGYISDRVSAQVRGGGRFENQHVIEPVAAKRRCAYPVKLHPHGERHHVYDQQVKPWLPHFPFFSRCRDLDSDFSCPPSRWILSLVWARQAHVAKHRALVQRRVPTREPAEDCRQRGARACLVSNNGK